MRRVLFSIFVLLASIGLSSAQEDRLQIVASHSILADVVSNVVGDAADVTSLMPLGADPHSFIPTPSDLTTLADADIVFVNGAMFEEGVMEAIENAGAEMNIVTASSCVQMIGFGGHGHDHEEGEEHDHAEDEEHDHAEGEEDDHAEDEEHGHEGGEEHDHAEGEEHDHEEGEMHEGEMTAIAQMCAEHYAEMEALHEYGDHHHEEGEEHDHADDEEHDHAEGEEHDHDHGGETLGALYAIDCDEGHDHGDEGEDHDEGEAHDHDHGACDPHVWTEPHNVMYWTMLIRDTLIALDTANAETYTANAAEYLTEVDALAHDFIIPMVDTVPEESRILVTNHDAFGYFANRHGFEIATTIIPGGSTLAEPSAADVAAIIDLIREEGVPAIFAETTVSDDLAQQIADETGAGVFVLYSGSLSEADEPASTYLEYMRYNVTTIVEALGGGM